MRRARTIQAEEAWLQEEQDLAQALHRAQQELRDLPRDRIADFEAQVHLRDFDLPPDYELEGDFPFAYPYFWSGFVLNGF